MKPKIRAKLRLLHHITEFSLARQHGGAEYCGLDGMRFHILHGIPDVGALVALSSAPLGTRWYLSWVVRVESRDRVLLESVETGELCWWGNVGYCQYDQAETAKHPEWRWTDAQFAVNDRWQRVVSGSEDGYIVRAVQAEFVGDRAVRLGTRTVFGLDDIRVVEEFPDWRKLTVKAMRDFYSRAVAERQRLLAERKPRET